MADSKEDDELSRQAIEFVKRNKQKLFESIIQDSACQPSDHPVAVFMAGTPGAGKTEIAKSLMSFFDIEPLRIDADEFRNQIPGYTGANSFIVQPAASLAVEKVLDLAYSKSLPFILDATFAVGKATENIKRALRKGYQTQIYFVYQDPAQAWNFTKIREKREGRYVPEEAFINAYLKSRENVRTVKNEFGNQVILRIIVKNYISDEHKVYDNVDDIDEYLPKLYTREELIKLLND